MTVQEILAESVLSCRDSLKRFLPGFTEDNCTQQAPHLPNHVVWCLGHVSLYLHNMAAELDQQPLPADAFVKGGGSEEQFDADAVAFGSQPGAKGARYPTLSRAVAIFESACQRLADAVHNASSQTIERVVTWHGMEIRLGVLVVRVLFHAGYHTGQIADLRRAMGMKHVW